MVKINKSLKASTLIETLAASVIIAISFGIGTMVYFNVLVSSKSISKERANYLMQSVMNESIKFDKLGDETIVLEGLTIDKSVSSYREPDLYKIELTTTENSKGLGSLTRLIYKK